MSWLSDVKARFAKATAEAELPTGGASVRPCPFCRSLNRLPFVAEGEAFVHCRGCRAVGPRVRVASSDPSSPLHPDALEALNEAIALWNEASRD